MKQYNPDSRLALAASFRERANAIKSGRGFWNGRVICNDPILCKEHRIELLDKARHLMIKHQELSYD